MSKDMQGINFSFGLLQDIKVGHKITVEKDNMEGNLCVYREEIITGDNYFPNLLKLIKSLGYRVSVEKFYYSGILDPTYSGPSVLPLSPTDEQLLKEEIINLKEELKNKYKIIDDVRAFFKTMEIMFKTNIRRS